MLKVLKTREALEKQKQDAELRMQEREEKIKQVMQDREDKMKEHMQQKKQHAQKKAAEIEERRKQEEAARLAKLKEQVRTTSPKLKCVKNILNVQYRCSCSFRYVLCPPVTGELMEIGAVEKYLYDSCYILTEER